MRYPENGSTLRVYIASGKQPLKSVQNDTTESSIIAEIVL